MKLPPAPPRARGQDVMRQANNALTIEALQTSDVFPALAGHCARHPLGFVTVRNHTDRAITGVVVSAGVDGFGRSADAPATRIAANATARLPVQVILDAAALNRHTAHQTTALSLILRWREGDHTGMARRRQGIVVHAPDATRWDDAATIAAFVQPAAEAIRDLVRQAEAAQNTRGLASPVDAAGAAGAVDAAGAEALGLSSAARVLGVMRALKIRYHRDPISPYGAGSIDSVKYAPQTIADGRGDCDDLAVLYASLAEAMGLQSMLVVTPDHVFAAAWTGVPAHNRAAFGPEIGPVLLEHQGMLWLPLETTLAQRPIKEGVITAHRLVQRWSKGDGDTLQAVIIRQAWRRYPPSTVASRSIAKAGEHGIGSRAGSRSPSRAKAATVAKDAQDAAMALSKWWARSVQDTLISMSARRLKRPEDGALTMEMGTLLALTGRRDAAGPLFAAKESAGDWRGQALNNAANLALLSGSPADALELYSRALTLTPIESQPGLHINAAVAAHEAGLPAAFRGHIFECLAAGADALVVRLGYAGYGGDGARGAQIEGGAGDIRTALTTMLAAQGRRVEGLSDRAVSADTSATRASFGDATAGVGAEALARHLHWMQ